MEHRTRPTLRCLRNDLKISVPPVDVPLDEVKHPLIAKANEQFATEDTTHERIRAIDDEVLFKVKIQRWRGAIWTQDDHPWLVAAGQREDNSVDDFYAALERSTRAARLRYNVDHPKSTSAKTYCNHLLPNEDDHERYRLEAGVRLIRQLDETVSTLIRASLRDGYEHTFTFPTFALSIQVRADDGHETYVAVRITGSVRENLVYLVLDLVPGCDRDGWYPEQRLPHRILQGAEQAWSNIMDPIAAAKLLDEVD
ncbi:MAG TPA: hypothetical protein VHX38_36130 [Pseudonocardiaceae bacterium]|jgi:hypothetical protein|nr:hypothetical protein [Pseudonocardiaceae bacterium]